MKLCDTCFYGDKYEYDKPCVIYSDHCEMYKKKPETPNNSAIPQKPNISHCKECKHFEYDSVAQVDGIPLIVAHEICSRWGDGCRTKEDGYCFLFEPQESEGEG